MVKKAKKKKRIRKRVVIGTIVLSYIGIFSYEPFLLATKWKTEDVGVTRTELEDILERTGILESHIDGLVFMKIKESCLEPLGSGDTGALYKNLPSMILLPDSENSGFLKNKSNYFLSEIGHYVYSRLPKGQKKRWEEYSLRFLQANFEAIGEVIELTKERELARNEGDRKKEDEVMNRILDINRYVIVPHDHAGKISTIPPDIAHIFNPDELFSDFYRKYFLIKKNSGFDPDRTGIAYVTEEGINLMSEFLKGIPVNSDARWSFKTASPKSALSVYSRYLNPISVVRTLNTLYRDRNHSDNIKGLGRDYERERIQKLRRHQNR